MIALLSPAKNMEFSSVDLQAEASTPVFIDRAAYLVEKLQKLSVKQLSKMMSINEELGALNEERFQKWRKEAKSEEFKPAVLAFNGEVYRNLKASDFTKKEMEFANRHLLILSGLYGLLKPMDNIMPYRLEMGSKWKVTPKQTNLYKYWASALSEEVNHLLTKHSNQLVINLASNEYVKAIDLKTLKYPMVHCHFLDWKNGEFRTVMTWAKQARGKMARHIVTKAIDKIEDLKKETFDKYSFNEKLSDEDNLVYTRKAQS
jgi:cytoplasmic iron level regulating protein YaaA (DUF328/UPF0246 family)